LGCHQGLGKPKAQAHDVGSLEPWLLWLISFSNINCIWISVAAASAFSWLKPQLSQN